MASLASLGARMTYYAQALQRNVHKAKQDVARVVHPELVRNTPVDTGKARSNWQVSSGTEIESEINPYAPGRHLGIGETANAAAAIAQGQAAIDACPPGQDIYIANNVDYIGKLNEGWSAQAPASFVEMAVIRGLDAAKNARVID